MNAKSQFTAEQENVLLQQASQGNLEAFNQLVLQYQNLAYNHAYTLLGDTDSAEDAAQEGFIKAFQALPTYRGGSFRSWLLRIITNVAYDNLRRDRRHPNQSLFPTDENGEEVESAAWLEDPAPSVQETVEQNELSHDIYAALSQLPDVYRNVITLIDINELDYNEAATVLKVPIGTIKSRLARARLQLQKKLRIQALRPVASLRMACAY